MTRPAARRAGRETLADDLLQAVGRVRRQARRQLNGPGVLSALTVAQADLVRVVRRNPGISVTAAAAELGVAANTVSTLVAALTAGKILRRDPDPADRRVARLLVTPRTARRLASRRDSRTALVSAAITALDAQDQNAIAAAVPALDRLADALAALSPELT